MKPKQVVSQKNNRRISHQFFANHFAIQTPLQSIETRRRIALPHQNFAIQNTAVGPVRKRILQLRKLFTDQLFTARPHPHLPTLFHHLGSNAVVFPFNQPIFKWAQLLRLFLQGMRQKKRQGLTQTAGVLPCAAVCGYSQQCAELLCGGLIACIGKPHHASGHQFGIQPNQFSQGTDHQQLGHPHSKSAAHQFHKQKSLRGSQFIPAGLYSRNTIFVGQIAQGQNSVLHPPGQALRLAGQCG